ncbi:hypothetical protein GCM10008967_25820 [Bacillus carboniphilus]|uniref:Prepilin-type N-terminal cleavage/methylation domain-containing protein n=1 Tax=Bacillus carboniphilus TaxID=86663 RepID=A0ABN0WDS5_9BACI
MKRYIGNESGLTLIELLGVFVISSIILTVIFSFFTFGSNAFQKDEAAVSLQNEANRIMTAITVAYYSEGSFVLEQKDENGDGKQEIVLNGAIISEQKFEYTMTPLSISSNVNPVELELTVIGSSEQITLKTYLRSVRTNGGS